MMERHLARAWIPSASLAKKEGGGGSSVEARPRGSVSCRSSTRRAGRGEGEAQRHVVTGGVMVVGDGHFLAVHECPHVPCVQRRHPAQYQYSSRHPVTCASPRTPPTPMPARRRPLFPSLHRPSASAVRRGQYRLHLVHLLRWQQLSQVGLMSHLPPRLASRALALVAPSPAPSPIRVGRLVRIAQVAPQSRPQLGDGGVRLGQPRLQLRNSGVPGVHFSHRLLLYNFSHHVHSWPPASYLAPQQARRVNAYRESSVSRVRSSPGRPRLRPGQGHATRRAGSWRKVGASLQSS